MITLVNPSRVSPKISKKEPTPWVQLQHNIVQIGYTELFCHFFSIFWAKPYLGTPSANNWVRRIVLPYFLPPVLVVVVRARLRREREKREREDTSSHFFIYHTHGVVVASSFNCCCCDDEFFCARPTRRAGMRRVRLRRAAGGCDRCHRIRREDR